MATTTRMTAIAALVAVVAIYGVASQAPEPAPAPRSSSLVPRSSSLSCFLALLNASDCLSYVAGGSEVGKPDEGCCPELAGLVESKPLCVCELMGVSDVTGVQIDLNKVLKLPSACGLSTAPFTNCSVGQPPEESPPSPSGVAAVASDPGNKDNGALGIKASALSYMLGLATAFVSVFF